MPHIGEIRRAYEIKATTEHHKCIWVPCENCGTFRWVFIKRGKPRSTRCRKCAVHPGKPRRGTMITCPTCKEEFYIMPSEVLGKGEHTPRQYCSKECHDKAQIAGTPLYCKLCQAEYYRPPSQIRLRGSSFCNPQCQGHWNSLNRVGPNSPAWKGGKSTINRRVRASKAWKDWRAKVFKRDNYTCQNCGDRSGNGHALTLHPHHIRSFAKFPQLRFDIANGITFCTKCHRLHTAWQHLGGLTLHHEKGKKRKAKVITAS